MYKILKIEQFENSVRERILRCCSTFKPDIFHLIFLIIPTQELRTSEIMSLKKRRDAYVKNPASNQHVNCRGNQTINNATQNQRGSGDMKPAIFLRNYGDHAILQLVPTMLRESNETVLTVAFCKQCNKWLCCSSKRVFSFSLAGMVVSSKPAP